MIKAKQDRHMQSSPATYLLALLVGAWPLVPTHAAGRLEASAAWIRTAPPGSMMLAGYVNLRNSGDAALTVVGAESTAFRSVSMHQSVEENGVERMRPLAKFAIAPGESVTFAPGGRHLMLMQPVRQLKSGDAVRIHIATESGEGASADFTVGDSAP
jgi:copper(I)-binding protein